MCLTSVVAVLAAAADTRIPLQRRLAFFSAVGDGWCGVAGEYYAPNPPALPILGDGL